MCSQKLGMTCPVSIRFSSYAIGNISSFIQLFCRRQCNVVIGKSGFGNDSCSVMNGHHLLGEVLHCSNTRGQQNV